VRSRRQRRHELQDAQVQEDEPIRTGDARLEGGLLDLALRVDTLARDGVADESNRFHVIDETSPARDTELAYTNLTVGPQVTFNITDWTHLDLYAAGAVYRRYELFERDESFAREGLSPAIGYGARLWIAPSDW
jgi:hypothetical protein